MCVRPKAPGLIAERLVQIASRGNEREHALILRQQQNTTKYNEKHILPAINSIVRTKERFFFLDAPIMAVSFGARVHASSSRSGLEWGKMAAKNQAQDRQICDFVPWTVNSVGQVV